MSRSMTKPEAAADMPAQLDAAAREALAIARAALAEGTTGAISDEAIQCLLAAGVRLYAAKVDHERRYFAPVPDDSGLTATDIAVATTELMRAVNLNLFDLSMWASRPRDEEVIDRSGRWS